MNTTRDEALARFNINVVAALGGLASAFANERAHIGFIGRFVLAEAHIAVDAEETVFGRGFANIFDRSEMLKNISQQSLDVGAGLVIALAVFVKPCFVIVEAQIFQKIEREFQILWHGCSSRVLSDRLSRG